TDENPCPVAAISPGVHPHPAAYRAWNRAGELEAAERSRPHAVQADGIRRAAPRNEHVVPDLRRGQLAAESQDKRLDALVCDEQIRAEPDRCDGQSAFAPPRERFLELVERAGLSERAG